MGGSSPGSSTSLMYSRMVAMIQPWVTAGEEEEGKKCPPTSIILGMDVHKQKINDLNKYDDILCTPNH